VWPLELTTGEDSVTIRSFSVTFLVADRCLKREGKR
jgi:hypothetical protein